MAIGRVVSAVIPQMQTAWKWTLRVVHLFASFIGIVVKWVAQLPAFLDWLLKVGERLVALAFVGASLFIGYLVVIDPSAKLKEGTSLKEAFQFLSVEWRVVLLAVIPLFYLTVRTFLEEVVEAFGMKRERKKSDQTPSEDETKDEQKTIGAEESK